MPESTVIIPKANGVPILTPTTGELRETVDTRRCYRDLAAAALYHMVMPVGGLRWEHLTVGQQQTYRDLIDAAAAATAVEGRA